MRKSLLIPVLALAFAVLAPTASAATVNVGNTATARTQVDSYSNFTIIDTNHPVSADGTLTEFHYYAANTNHLRLVLVDGANVVKWLSDELAPVVGANTHTPAVGVAVSAGWNLGVYSVSTGVIPFEFTGLLAPYTPNGNGLPVVGSTLANEGFSGRTYSLGATGETVTPPTPTEPPTEKDECKDGGWMNGDYKNQGQCVSSFVSQRDEAKDNHGQAVRGVTDKAEKKEMARSTEGMPAKSNKGHNK